jgi:hypothetical protein
MDDFKQRKQQIYTDILKYRIDLIKTYISNWSTISNFSIDIFKIKNNIYFSFEYTHETKNFTTNNYCYEEDEEDKTLDPIYKKTNIKFGFDKLTSKYFILNSFIQIMQDDKKLVPYNKLYDYTLGLDEQEELINKYEKNINIPEWFMLRLLKIISYTNILDDLII